MGQPSLAEHRYKTVLELRDNHFPDLEMRFGSEVIAIEQAVDRLSRKDRENAIVYCLNERYGSQFETSAKNIFGF